MAQYYDRKPSANCNLEDSPHSRLFVVGSKSLSEDDFRAAFEQFGHIEEIWMVKDRQSGDNKGVTYIKYSKTSEAAKALESMNGKCIGNLNRSIRVMIAASRDQGSKRESNEEEKILRLFVVVQKTMTDSELYDYFRTFGDVDYATIMRDKETRESKGFAYVKYFRFSHAAAAFEKCDRKYKAVFAEPRKPNIKNEEKYSWSPSNSTNRILIPEVVNPNGYTKLIAVVSPNVNQDQLWKLFDIVPGMDYCHLKLDGYPNPVKGIASVVYNSSQSAAYAKEKLHGFEYPPGNRIIVKPDYEDSQYFDSARPSSSGRHKHADIFQIAETIAKASNLIQASGMPQDVLQARLGMSKDGDVNCSVRLPGLQALASSDEQTVARCFIVCTPTPLPNAILKNVFSRFGHLIDVYMLKNRNCGFAKYASQESAEAAIKTLHGADVCGTRIKVLKAEERQDCNRKRQRLDEKS